MTSPLSILRKNRRAPLPQSHSERERRAETERSPADLFSRRQLGSEVTDSLINPLMSKVTVRRRPKEVSPPTDFELMSSMMQKLAQLERKVTSQALEINKKTRRIAVLEEKLQLLQEKAQREQQQDEDDLRRKCSRLQKQVWEMEKFLNDYGMIWVGDGDGDGDGEDEVDEVEAEESSQQRGAPWVRGFPVNFDLLMQRIRDLNVVAGEGGAHITFVPGGAKLTREPAVDLQLYRNGMVLSHGPFRPYTQPRTQRFLHDLMDGFFPLELQKKFPQGVLFQVIDRRDEEFRTEFPGKGHTMGGSEQEVMRYRQEASETQQSVSPGRAAERKLSTQQFLNKLPECVVKAGNVIEIRSALRHHLQDADGVERCVIETPASQTLSERPDCEKGSEISRLRVRSEDGDKTFLLKMFFSETIGHLRRYLDCHRGSGPPYDIISALPHRRCHSDDKQTLLQCGLTPSAALLLWPRPLVTS